MISKQTLIGATGGALAVMALGAAAFSMAATTTPSATAPARHAPGVGGTVTAVQGNTITVTGKNGTTYTIDAGSATITKDETVSVADVKVGDTVMADGTVSGTSVAATTIHDGQMPMGGRGFGGPGRMGMGVHGTVSTISDNTLTVTQTNPKDNTTKTFSVDASSATVMLGSVTAGQKPTTGSLSSIKVGDSVMVAGTTSGTSVTAKMIFDGPLPAGGAGWGKKPAATTTSTTPQ